MREFLVRAKAPHCTNQWPNAARPANPSLVNALLLMPSLSTAADPI